MSNKNPVSSDRKKKRDVIPVPESNDRVALNYYRELSTTKNPTPDEEVDGFQAYEDAVEVEVECIVAVIQQADLSEKVPLLTSVRNENPGMFEAATALLKTAKSTRQTPKALATARASYAAIRLRRIELGKKMACGYLKFVAHEARKFRPRDEQILKDLISEGNIGLMKAVQKFDVSMKNRFLTYASYWIRVQMQEYLYRCPYAVHVPSHTRKELRKKKAEEEGLIASGVLSRSTVVEPSVGPLDPNIQAGDADTEEPATTKECNLLHYMVEANLPERDRFILIYTFGLRDAAPKNFCDLSQLLYEFDGSLILAEQVREIRDTAMKALGGYMRTRGFTSANDLV